MLLGKTAGIELEFEDLPPDHVSSLVRAINNEFISWGLTRDASCEMQGKFTKAEDGRIVKIFGEFPHTSPKRLGGELRTNLLDLSQEKALRNSLEKICVGLREMGESQQSLRAGIHIHINSGQMTLEMLRSLTKTASFLEPVFFGLGGMGYQFRGFQNNYTYSRPITKFGPTVVKVPGGLAQSLNVKDCFEAQKFEEFFEKWGDTYQNNGMHMFPSRYCWFNLSSVIQRGSAEFRIFNKSLNPDKIWAITKFCSEVVGFSIKHSFTKNYLERFSENSIYDISGITEISNIFEEFALTWELGEIKNILRQLINQAHFSTIQPDPNYYFSHLFFHANGDRTRRHWEISEYRPKLIPKETVKKPKFFDSHSIQTIDLSPFNPKGLRF